MHSLGLLKQAETETWGLQLELNLMRKLSVDVDPLKNIPHFYSCGRERVPFTILMVV